ncbi:MAG: FAD-dependent oxidoreductase [Acidimicrobiaceae bacterium]|nr:FAD-dependent oxidoreductase [Acidimicrobiaceae bacterium]
MVAAPAACLSDELPPAVDVLVIGAGIIGCAVAVRLAAHGLGVCVVDRLGPAAGSSSAGEGNVLVSDKLPGADLALALRSVALWRQLGERLGREIEFELKGGVVVARSDEERAGLFALAREQQLQGARVQLLDPEELHRMEPELSRDLAGGVFYEQDAQVQPMLVVAAHIAELRRLGGRVVRGAEVLGAGLDSAGRIRSVMTSIGAVAAEVCVVNAAGPWASFVAERLGVSVPVTPRRGHVLVTEPVPQVTEHKVYEAGYVGAIHGTNSQWTVSAVVESTASGTMLLGSSREFVGFSRRSNPEIVAAIARRSLSLFPSLEGVRLLRTYLGFRPATPDRLPILGEDPSLPGLLHATGHEGAGIGLAEVTGEVIEDLVLGRTPHLDLGPFTPRRFVASE